MVDREMDEEAIEYYTCNICMEDNLDKDFRFKLFPCQHYACSECVDKMLESSTHPTQILCHECRMPVDLPIADYRRANEVAEKVKRRRAQEQLASTESATLSRGMEPQLPDITPDFTAGIELLPADNNPENELEGSIDYYVHLIENEKRCVMSCDPTWHMWRQEFLSNIEKVFHKPGKSWYKRKGDDKIQINKQWVLTLPFRLFFKMIRIMRPCASGFSSDETFSQRSIERAGKVREAARNTISNTAKYFMPKQWDILWSGLMLAVVGINIICDSVSVANHRHVNTAITGCVLNVLLAVVWVVILIHNIKHKTRILSQLMLQQFFSELSVYPQICVSGTVIRYWDAAPIFPFALCILLLIIIWILRLISLVKYREYVSNVFKRLLLAVIGNYLIVGALIGYLAYNSKNNENSSSSKFAIVISVVLSVTSAVSMGLFYVSHLYEITQQAALLVIDADTDAYTDSRMLIKDLNKLHPFHKNLYSNVFVWSKWIVLLWFVPVVSLIACRVNSHDGVMVIIYSALTVIVNYKISLVSTFAYLTLIAIILYCCSVAVLVLGISCLYLVMVIIASPFLCIYLIVKCKQNDRKSNGNSGDIEQEGNNEGGNDHDDASARANADFGDVAAGSTERDN